MKKLHENSCLVQIAICFLFPLNSKARPELAKAQSTRKWIDVCSIFLSGIARLLLLLELLHGINLNQSTLKMLELIDPFLDLLGWLLRFF
jgi:hypothetical protein